MGTVYNMNFGTGKMEPIEVESKSKLPRGTVLHLYGYNEPDYVIINRIEIDTRYGHGAVYQTVNPDTHEQHRHDALSLSWPADGKRGIHTEITDKVLPESEVAALWEKSETLRREKETQRAKADREYTELVEKGRALFDRYIPKDAKALIVAEQHVDESDCMTDYFSHSTKETVILAWSKHTKDLFPEMRKAAMKIPETEHLGPNKGHFTPYVVIGESFQSNGSYYHKGASSHWHSELDGGFNRPVFATREEAQAFIDEKGEPGSVGFEGQTIPFAWKIEEQEIEHREKWSMGNGYYLKDGHSNSSGWCVRKITKYRDDWDSNLLASIACRCVFEDEPKQTTTQEPEPKAEQCGGVIISTYKGNPTISLPIGERSFTFGKAKAQAILDHIEEIRAFVGANHE